jgi:hypothetical protein
LEKEEVLREGGESLREMREESHREASNSIEGSESQEV